MSGLLQPPRTRGKMRIGKSEPWMNNKQRQHNLGTATTLAQLSAPCTQLSLLPAGPDLWWPMPCRHQPERSAHQGHPLYNIRCTPCLLTATLLGVALLAQKRRVLCAPVYPRSLSIGGRNCKRHTQFMTRPLAQQYNSVCQKLAYFLAYNSATRVPHLHAASHMNSS